MIRDRFCSEMHLEILFCFREEATAFRLKDYVLFSTFFSKCLLVVSLLLYLGNESNRLDTNDIMLTRRVSEAETRLTKMIG